MRDFWNFYSAGRLVFGKGIVNQCGSLLSGKGWKGAFIITDQSLASAGHVDKVRDSLSSIAGMAVQVFDEGEPEPSIETALKALNRASDFGPDVIIGLGGGSNIDLAKMIACTLRHGGNPRNYFGAGKVPGPVVPLVAIPTTAGTGSEVSQAAVLTDNSNHLKVSTLSPFLRPQIAIVDPELTVTCPASVTAESGMDALTHAIEAYTNTYFHEMSAPPEMDLPYDGKNPMTDIFAEKAIRLIAENLVTAVREPKNIRAREGMALAATLAGLAFSNAGVAMVHGLEYPIGGAHYCSHGQGNALLLPYVMDFNRSARPSELADIATWLGADTSGMDADTAAMAGIQKVRDLKAAVGIPDRLRDLRVPQESLREFAEKSAGIKRLMDLSPRPATADDLYAILQSAW